MITKAFVKALRSRVDQSIEDTERRRRINKRLRSLETATDNSGRLLDEVIQILQEERDYTRDIRDDIKGIADEDQALTDSDWGRLQQIVTMLDMGANDVVLPLSEDEWVRMLAMVDPSIFGRAINSLPDKRITELLDAISLTFKHK